MTITPKHGSRSPLLDRARRHPWKPILVFLVLGLLVLSVSRLGLIAWQWERVSAQGGLAALVWGGLRIDVALLSILTAAWVALAPWAVGSSPVARAYRTAQSILLVTSLAAIVFVELATPSFVGEFGLRPNRLFVEYLDSPREVSATIWAEHRAGLLIALVLVAAFAWGGWRTLRPGQEVRLAAWKRPMLSTLGVACAILGARSGLQHRPINPASVAFSDDPLVNALALNSLYNVGYEVYRLRKEVDTEALYGRMPEAEMLRRVREAAGRSHSPVDPSNPALHSQAVPIRAGRPKNLVVIVEESLGARYVGALGGLDLTPNLDALSREGWWFERLYATGTRSARGLEAIVSGFPPSPARAVLDLPRAQGGFFTLAALLRRRGYRATFVYGGEGHFDNMQGFFLANGFHAAIDGGDYEDPVFEGSWGVSDEDLLERVHQELLASEGPAFVLAFSVSNHSPWEFPRGRVTPYEEPLATRNNSVQYADWALGDFFRKARGAPYWADTLFLVVADHDSRVYGHELVPVEHFHIPGVILGADVAPRSDPRLASQIDLAPTLLSLLGIDAVHPMIGRDLTSLPADDPGRALLQYDHHHGYWLGEHLVVHSPGRPPLQYRCTGGPLEPEPLDPELAATALAHALWPGWAYLNQRYTLPPEQPSLAPRFARD